MNSVQQPIESGVILDREDTVPPAKARSAPKPKKIVALVVVVALAAFGARSAYDAHFYEETDDAQVDADLASVSPRISGTIQKVLVQENQLVEEGQALATMDTTELEVALAQAKAYVAQAEAQLKAEDPGVAIAETSNETTIATTSSEVSGASAELASATASRKRRIAELARADVAKKLASQELDRAVYLQKVGASTPTDLDEKRAAFDAAKAARDAASHDVNMADETLHQMRFRIVAAKSRHVEAEQNAPRELEVKRAQLEVRRTNVDVAKAQLAQATLNLQYAQIVAPIRGIIGRKSVSVGDRVQPGQALLAITPVDHLWVTANFRETQLRAMHPSQRATFHVDALDRDFVGFVESMPGATGARYSLLPPENATGNYVKVVQRMPVRIRLDEGQPEANRLRPGMSVEPKVRVR